jgi:8-oxo-dGTP pyrophosphatase MutT (NUDIX family)
MKIYTEQDIREVSPESPELRQYKKILAAGGLVQNEKGEVLLIFRRGKWDLPKGKVENNEPLELCAQRETKEETGLSFLELQRFLVTTYHTYSEGKQLILKETHWYLYRTAGTPQLSPQTEEDIFKAEWVPLSRLEQYTSNTFRLITDVLKEAGIEEVSGDS